MQQNKRQTNTNYVLKVYYCEFNGTLTKDGGRQTDEHGGAAASIIMNIYTPTHAHTHTHTHV